MARDPEYAGSPFCDISPGQAHRVKELLERAEREQSADIEFAKDVLSFSDLLHREAKGERLTHYYNMAPASLRGLFELVYDYYNNPTVRFIEGLLYASKHYNKKRQSFRIFRLFKDKQRPFFLSTPRFVDAGEIEWKASFDDPALDMLLDLDINPQPVGRIIETLGLKERDEWKVVPHLSPDRSILPERWKEKGVRIRYFGHACVLLEWNGVAILTDPNISAVPAIQGVERLSFQDLPEKIDFALVTHEHQDHFSVETLLRLRKRIECLVVPKSSGLLYGDVSLKLMSSKIGFKRVEEIDSLESIPLPDGEIISIPFLGEHGDLAQAKRGYVVRAGRE